MKQLLFSLSFLISFCGFSQTSIFSLKVGTEYELPRKAEDIGFFGSQKDGVINLSSKKGVLSIQHFDPVTLEKTGEEEKDLPDISSSYNGEGMVDFGNNHYWLHSDWDKGAEKEYLYYDKFDIKTGSFAQRDVKLIELTKLGGRWSSVPSGTFVIRATGKYRFYEDADATKLLVGYKLAPKVKNDKKNNDVIGFYVFDNTLKKLWNTEYTLPTFEQVTDIIGYSLDSKGNAYLLTKIFDTEKRFFKAKDNDGPGYHFEVSKFTKDSKEPQITRIEAGNNFIREATLMETKLHEMVVSCTYSKSFPFKGMDGIFIATIDNSGKLKTHNDGLYEFPISELLKYESSKKRKKIENKEENPEMSIRYVVPATDGGILAVCEQYKSEHVTDTRGSYNHTFFYYDDIYCMKIDPKGNMEYCTKIPKQQLGTDSYETLGFKMVADKDNYYFLYVDNKKNVDLAEDDDPKEHLNGYGGRIMAAKIDGKGKLSKEILMNPFEEKMMFIPTALTSLDGNKFLGRAMMFHGGMRPVLISAN